LKELFTSTPILKITDPGKDFVVCTDSCMEGLGGVLMQEVYVICYELCKLKEHEKNYVMHDLELAAIVHALKMWRNYLVGRRFKLRTNHMSLKYMFEQLDWNARQARWMEFLCEFDFKIKHVWGKENKFVDALSRKFHIVAINTCQLDLRARIFEALHRDETQLQVREEL
jgi:hypothetical protein